MKRFVMCAMAAALVSVFSGCLSLGSASAPAEPAVLTVPEGRELFVAVWDYVTNNDELVCEVEELNVMDQMYALHCEGVMKGILGHNRYRYTVTIQAQLDGTAAVLVLNPQIAACEADGTLVSSSSYTDGGVDVNASVVFYRDALQTAITVSDNQYQSALNDTLTNPEFLLRVSRSVSSLYFDTFVENYQIIGRSCTVSIPVSTVQESLDPDYAYQLSGIIYPIADSIESLVLYYYSNNDAVVMQKEGEVFFAEGKILHFNTDVLSGEISSIAYGE